MLLGELHKYVPLSQVRFRGLACSLTGLAVDVSGQPGEKVAVTAIGPHKGSYVVSVKHTTIGPSGTTRAQFP